MSNDQSASEHDQDKAVTIVINGTLKEVSKGELSYAELIALAFDKPPTGDGVQFSIQYTRGHKDNPKDSMVEGQSVKVKEGMEFDVTPTNRS